MVFGGLLKTPARKQFTVTADTVTKTGALHESDKIPNQDMSFTMLQPRSRLAAKKGPPGPATTQGIYSVGVFDGHGDDGHTASKIACDVAKKTLRRLFECDNEHGKIEDYLRLTFQLMSNELNAHPCSIDSGTTATIAVVYDSEIVIAHCGDSCGLVISASGAAARKPQARHVTDMHRPESFDERQRIEAAGGLVMEGYVVDKVTKRKGIAVTRTLGDRDMHKSGCTSEPVISTLQLQPTDTAITLATDGLWDCEGVVVQDVMDAVKAGDLDPTHINQSLLDTAAATGPSDDCTIATLVFKEANNFERAFRFPRLSKQFSVLKKTVSGARVDHQPCPQSVQETHRFATAPANASSVAAC